jgi:hypothetical protein
MKGLERANVLAAYLALAVFLAVLSPVADPARLTSGAVRPDAFDFAALKFDGARWGAEALTKLSHTTLGSDAAVVSADARAALALANRWRQSAKLRQPLVTVYRAGRSLPPGIAGMGPVDWKGLSAACFISASATCTARFVRLRTTGPQSPILLDVVFGYVLDQSERGEWRVAGRLVRPVCDGFRKGLAGEAPQLKPHPWPDLVAGGSRVSLYSESCSPLLTPNAVDLQ